MILILMQISFIVMGTFLDDTAMLVIVAPLYIPLVGALGFDLIWYGVLYTITTQSGVHDSAVWLQLVFDACDVTTGNWIGRYLPIDRPVRFGHGGGACAGHVVSTDCTVAAGNRLRQIETGI